MKRLIILLISITTGFSGFTQTGKMPQGKTDTTAQIKYTCTMHPNEVSDKQGNCPICGKQLVVDRRGSKQLTQGYVCPMHPNEISDKAGKCPICGKEMVEKKSTKRSKVNKSES